MDRGEKPAQSQNRGTKLGQIPTTDPYASASLARSGTEQSLILSESDNSPRRGYAHGAPAAYRAFRNHVFAHLRNLVPLERLLDIRWSEFAWSSSEVALGDKKFSGNRTIVEVFESFLEKRSELARVIPALNDPNAFLFPALDGGALFVSHRPRGITHEGLHEFVTSRDLLFGFLYKTMSERDLAGLAEMNVHEFKAMQDRVRKDPSTYSRLEPLVSDYLAAKERWLGNLHGLTQMLKDGSEIRHLTTFLESLNDEASLPSSEHLRISELRQLRDSLEQERLRKSDVTLRGNRLRTSQRQGHADPDIESPENEELSQHFIPVYTPNPRLIFLGTDGGALFGDTGYTCSRH